MTVLKFRAWDIHRKRMYNNEQLIIWNGNVYANEAEKLCADKLKGWSVDDKYLMQSTGLFDANGREVFAGDIVLINQPPFDCQGVVKYYNGCWWIACGGIAFCLYDEVKESLVIGNIYENKEMVENNEL